MDLFVAGRDQSAADQPNNLAERHTPHCNHRSLHLQRRMKMQRHAHPWALNILQRAFEQAK